MQDVTSNHKIVYVGTRTHNDYPDPIYQVIKYSPLELERMKISLLLSYQTILIQLLCLRLGMTLAFTSSSQSKRPGFVSTSHHHLHLFASRASSTDHGDRYATTTPSTKPLGNPICLYHQVTISTTQSGPPRQAVAVEDLTPILQDLLVDSGMQQGTVTVISRHTTTAITINERERRLARDMEQTFLRLIPPDERSSASNHRIPTTMKANARYLHNDIDQRPESVEEAQRCRDNGWDIDNPQELEKWRNQEPINAHSHLLSMMLGSSESIPVVDGDMVIGQWQSVLLVDLDGPRDRTVGIQLMGYQ